MTSTTPIRISGREIPFFKASESPAFGQRTVLTNSPWTYVGLWLKRDGQKEALFYWEQARQFFKASIDLPIQSAPLLLYYTYMNATKSLLAAKNISFDPMHGVKADPATGHKLGLNKERVRILSKGVLPSLSGFYNEPETSKTHSLTDLLFNVPIIHRTFCLTYTSQAEMFLPLKNCRYVFDPASSHVFFSAQLASDVKHRHLSKRLPLSLIAVAGSPRDLRSTQYVTWSRPNNPSASELSALADLHKAIRLDVQYISGAQTLWYVKALTSGPTRILRFQPTLILAAMHRLSEICRYRPMNLSAYLDGQKTWLLSEFIAMSPNQFIDEIASEITGHQFLVPNVRAPL
jgi:hypothetical protein